MDSDRIKGTWREIKGKVQERWGELTDDELDMIEGRQEQLVGIIQKHYGYAKEEAEREVEQWQRSTGAFLE
jgi:uncharacterized protein YjbJ (UPF0337 family)